MATACNLLMVVSLLVLSAPQRCSGVDYGSVDLKFLNNTLKEGLRLHEENSEALNSLQQLPEMVRMMNEKINKQNELIDSVLRQHDSSQREEELSQEIAVLRKKVKNKRNAVRHLEESVAECQQIVTNQTSTVELLRNKVQVLAEIIIEYRKKEAQMNETQAQLNNTEAAQKNDTASTPEGQLNQTEIIRLVQQFNNDKDWRTLRRGLEAVLGRSSEMYGHLQRVKYNTSYPLFEVGLVGCTHLVTLLLDAGLPVDAVTKSGGNTMLKGAVQSGHLQLVQLLLDRGANVDTRDLYGRTPLTYAAELGRLEVLKELLTAGADATIKDKYNYTALYYAKIYYHRDVVQYLEEHTR